MTLLFCSLTDRSQRRNLTRACSSIDCNYFVLARQYLLNCSTLARAEVGLPFGNLTPGLGTHKRFAFLLPGSYDRDGVPLILNYSMGCKGTRWASALPLN